MGTAAANRKISQTPKKPRGKPFEAGNRANPSGRPKKTEEERMVDELCKEKSIGALKVIENLMLNSSNEKVQFAAAQYIVDRGNGKPVSKTELTGAGGGAINTNHSVIVEFVGK